MERKDCIEQLEHWEPLLLKQSRFKTMVHKFLSVNPKKLWDEIEQATCVSFDIFDTLVKRDVATPTDVFTLIERNLENKKECTFSIPNFARLRIKAEKQARAAIPNREVTLQEIYEYMPLQESQRNVLIDIECRTEVNLSAVNLELKPFYDYCLKKGKKIIFISDMYLPMEVVKKILDKNGFVHGKLYVSSDNGWTKHGGKLFRYVQEKENINRNTWLHIGDNLFCDYLVPRCMGIKAFLIERNPMLNIYVNKKLYRENPMYQQLAHFINIHISRYTDPYERIGYAVLGPMLYGFSTWLEKEIPQDETIVFLAREGALLKKAFEKVSTRPSVYIRVSRHALNCVRLDHAKSVDEILNARINGIKPHSKLAVWAKMYGLSNDDVNYILQCKGLDKETVIEDEALKKRFLTAIWPVAKNNTRGQYDLFRAYLKQLNISGNCAAVDVGWTGTMQAYLTGICEDKHEVDMQPVHWKGYYMGISLMGSQPPYDKYEKKGFLFDGSKNNHIRESVEYSHDFFEVLTLSTDGTTEGYTKTSDSVQPVLAKPDNPGENTHRILSLQAAGIAFIQDIMKSNICAGKFTAEIAAANYEALARTPSLKTLQLFRDFCIYDEKALALVEGEPIWTGILHPRKLMYDFLNAGNKAWFLKNVFRLPFPYATMISFAKKLLRSEEKKKKGNESQENQKI